jgi:uncharacterized protein YjbJ (UPF0337 family)
MLISQSMAQSLTILKTERSCQVDTFGKDNWKEAAGKLKLQDGNMTNDDLRFIIGKEEELLGRLQHNAGSMKEEIRNLILKL